MRLNMPRPVRTAVAIAATAAVLLSGLWAGGSCTAARADTAAPDRVRGAEPVGGQLSSEIPIGESLVVSGQPMRLSVSYTTDSPASVAELYSGAFRARGLLPIAAADGRFAHVSSFDPEDGFQRSVTAVRESSGQTLVLLGVTDPRHAPMLATDAREVPFPVPENHRALLGHSSHDGQSRANSAQYVTALGPAEVAAFYRARFGTQGYVERLDHSSDGLLLFAKDGASVSVAVQALAAHSGAAVFVTAAERQP
jgi:hypothetical protein